MKFKVKKKAQASNHTNAKTNTKTNTNTNTANTPKPTPSLDDLSYKCPSSEDSPYVFLDDERNPGHLIRLKDGVWPHGPKEDWRVFRDAESLIEAFDNGFLNNPELILSLDHDLGHDKKTGYDFLNWLVNQHLDEKLDISKYKIQVHSANPVGSENMRTLWESFQRSLNV
jgi:hypothetical protein